MKTILVPVDFSKYSENALEVACYMAKIKGMRIRITHVLEDPYLPYYNFGDFAVLNDAYSQYYSKLEETIREQLNRLSEYVTAKGIQSEYSLENVSNSIADAITDQDADLIIMGSKKPDNEEGLLIGSIAEKIIRLSAIPVITVSEIPADFAIKKILFASDFEESSISPMLERVKRLSEIFKADLQYVIINTPVKYGTYGIDEEKVKEILNKFNIPGSRFKIYYADSEIEGINKYASEIKADLISVCTHGRTGLSHLFRQSVSEHLSSYSKVPVLVYNINPKKIDRSSRPITRESRSKERTRIKK
jgi:nucleotide-binding universal stress UspA family protein